MNSIRTGCSLFRSSRVYMNSIATEKWQTRGVLVTIILRTAIMSDALQQGRESQVNSQTKCRQIIEIDWVTPRAQFVDSLAHFEGKAIEMNRIWMIVDDIRSVEVTPSFMGKHQRRT